MLQINEIKLPVNHDGNALLLKAAHILHVDRNEIKELKILRRSLEARKGEKLSYVYSAAVTLKKEDAALKRIPSRLKTKIRKYEPSVYRFPYAAEKDAVFQRPVIIGAGPAGLFCAWELARAGFRPLVIERGKTAAERKADVEEFWKTGVLKPDSNVQFGEGGAGTFSDGKLNTQVGDRMGRKAEVLSIFIRHGAAENIAYDAKPHLGTDVLMKVIPSIRNEITAMGGEFRFRTACTALETENSRLSAIITSEGERIPADCAVLAIGHSARDTFQMLYDEGLSMEAKAFAVGVRISHPQELINANQWGEDYPESLGSASYNLAVQLEDGRGVYSFCMCPGGYVVNASSEEGMLAVNGMSYSGRSSGRANSAIVVTVAPEDYSSETGSGVKAHPLSGILFQRDLEKKAYEAGRGCIPVQLFSDFEKGIPSVPAEGLVNMAEASAKGRILFGNVRGIFPERLAEDLTEGIRRFDGKIAGFAGKDTLVYGVESRTSSPVRILRDENLESSLPGLFPCGEGAGYAGGIISAAMDGIRTAEAAAAKISGLVCGKHPC